jgi:hypothetical protein
MRSQFCIKWSSFHWSIIDASVPNWNEFKNSVVSEIGHLHSQQFMNSHFHFLITVELATSQYCVWQCCVALRHAAGSQPVTDHLFGSLKQHLGGCQFHNNEEAEMVILDGYECKSPFCTRTEASSHPPEHPMATVMLRHITKGTFYRSVLTPWFLYNTYYCTELLWQTFSADYATLTGDWVEGHYFHPLPSQ